MPSKQATLGKFFGGRDAPTEQRKKQSTLTEHAKAKVKDKDGEGKENEPVTEAPQRSSPDLEDLKDSDAKARTSNGSGSGDIAMRDAAGSPVPSSPPKRKSDTDIADQDMDEAAPPSKRRKRARVISDDEDEIVTTTSTNQAAAIPRPSATEEEEDSALEEEQEESENDSDPPSELEEDVLKTTTSKPASKASKAAKAREKAQSTLLPEKDLFPDWPAGEPVPYAALCATFSAIELTTKRLVISSHSSRFMRQILRLTPSDLLPTVQLMINKLAADYAGVELGIGESLIMKAIGETTGRSLAVVKQDQKSIGDLGLVAAKSRGTQRLMFAPKPLTVKMVFSSLLAIATAQEGAGAQTRKVDAIKKLLSAADVGKKIDITVDKGGPSEAKFIIRFLEGKLRLGLAEKTVLVALAHALVSHEVQKKANRPPTADEVAEGEATLKSVYSELPNYDIIIPAVLEHGMAELRAHCKLQPGIPLKPMLAKPTKSITEVLDRFEGQAFTCEYKYDGERAQIHYVAASAAETSATTKNPLATLHDKTADAKGLAAIFSRNSEDLSKKYPDILSKLGTWIKPETKSFVLDCETVAWDVEEKRVKPFQQLMTRKRKDVKAEDVKVKVCVFAFDLLFHNGQPVVAKTLRERRELLRESFHEVEGEFRFAQGADAREVDEIQALLDESVKASCEGLMVKMLDTAESGYEPSKRSRNWLKVKKDYLAGIGDSLDLVVLGAYYGKGKRTNWYGAFLLACWNADAEAYETVCNIGTGFSEQVLDELHNSLSQFVIERSKPFYTHSSVPKDQPDVWFEPRQVWEVKAADLTLSPRYKAGAEGLSEGAGKGISLRFPRFIRVREDKKPDEATGADQIIELYRKQEAVTKNKGPSVDDDFEY